jgi:hypothetical protein
MHILKILILAGNMYRCGSFKAILDIKELGLYVYLLCTYLDTRPIYMVKCKVLISFGGSCC